MSQNQLAKCPLGGLEQTLRELEKLAELNRLLCLQAFRDASVMEKDSRVFDYYEKRFHATSDLVLGLIRASRNPEATHTATLKRARIETASGLS